MTFWRRIRGGGRATALQAESEQAQRTQQMALNDCIDRAVEGLRTGDLASALTALTEALALDAEHPRALVLSARLKRRSNEYDEALRHYDQALLSAPEPGRIHLEIGETLVEKRDLLNAIDAFNVAVSLDPALCEAWLRLGDVYLRLDRFAEGLDAYQHARDTAPAELAGETWFQLGQALHLLKRHAEAVEAYSTSLTFEPRSLNTLMAIGHAELIQENDEAALGHYENALALSDEPPPALQLHLATAYQYCGRWRDAQRMYERVLAVNPNDHLARWYLSQCDLALCNWERGWNNYKTRFAAGASPYRPLPFKPWDGSSAPRDTLLILADQGLGDEIMFASCVPDAMKRVGHCILECEPRLENLFRRSFPGATIVGSNRKSDPSWLEGLPEPRWQIFGGDLPAHFRRTDAEFPESTGFLEADPVRVAYWRKRLTEDLGPGLKIGLSWRGGTQYTRTRSRSLDAADLDPILATPQCRFVNLQYGAYASELQAINSRGAGSVHDYPEALSDYDETAALVSALDLVISVCTAVVHLSGALGRQAWVLVPFSPGWRYTVERTRMPWYPSTRLFRQPSIGDWSTPCRDLSAELLRLTRNVT
jgi:tetratricopeptide (TPR) repeat protein